MIKNTILTKPSFWGNAIQGLLILFFLIFFLFKWKQFQQFSFYQKCIIILLIGILIGMHSLLHLGLEIVYNWNPLEGKWI